MADVFEKLVKDGSPIGQHMDRAHGYFAFPKLEGELGPRMQFRGKEMIVWSLNNYLGLVNHPEIRKIDAVAAAKFYDQLWQEYINENPELLLVIRSYSGLSDIYGQQGRQCQATSLWKIRNASTYDDMTYDNNKQTTKV